MGLLAMMLVVMVSFAARAAAGAVDAAVAQPSLETLVKALDDPNDNVRHMAISALSDMKNPAAVPALLLARRKAEREWKGVIDRALADLVAPANVDVLIQTMTDPDPDMRNLAVRLLGEVPDPRSYEPLSAVLNDKDGNLKLVAVQSLGKVGDGRAVEDLLPLLDGDDAMLRDESHKALVACAGGDYGTASRKWNQHGARYKTTALACHAAWYSGRWILYRGIFVAVLAGLAAWLHRPYIFAAVYALPVLVLGLMAQVPEVILAKQLLMAAGLGVLYFWMLEHFQEGGVTWWAIALPGVVILASV
jgi:hypothetical protein